MRRAKPKIEEIIQKKNLLKIDRRKNTYASYFQFYENLSNPIVIISPKLVIEYLNTAAEDFYNLKKEYLIGKSCRDEFGCKSLNNTSQCPVMQVLCNGESLNLKMASHFGINNSYIRVFPIRNEQEKITRICFEDFSGFVKIKNQAEKSESRFRKIVGVAAFAIFVLGKDYIIEFANPSAEEMLEKPSRNIEGSDFRNYLQDKDVLNLIKDLYNDTAGSGRVCFYSDKLIHFGKNKLNVVELCLTKAKEQDEEKIYIYLRNITREIKLQDDLKQTNEFLRNLINSAPNCIIASDIKGNIIIFNEKAEKLLGYSAEEAKKKLQIDSIYPQGYVKEMMGMLRSEGYGGTGKMKPVDAITVDVEGNEIPCSLSAYLIYDKNGNEEALVCIFYDIHARKQIQKELEETQMKLFQSEKMSSLGKLAAGIAHEINNPLGGLMIFADMILEDLDENDAHREDLMRIASEAKRCKNIVKGLLEFSRQTGNTMNYNNINELLEQGMFLLENQAIFHNIDVVKEYDEALPPVKCDSAKLKQVFINITLNAIDAMGAKGVFTIKTRHNRERKKAEIEFSDTGCGIPEDIRQKIFDPFFSTKEVGKGTGLGLSMSYGIIKDQGGTINVKSEVGRGATFIIELPIED